MNVFICSLALADCTKSKQISSRPQPKFIAKHSATVQNTCRHFVRLAEFTPAVEIGADWSNCTSAKSPPLEILRCCGAAIFRSLKFTKQDLKTSSVRSNTTRKF